MLWSIRAAAVNKVKEIATCAATRRPRTRFFAPELERSPDSLSVVTRLFLESNADESAGITPNAKPVHADTTTVKTSTDESIWISAVRVVNRPAKDVSSGSPNHA